jgi:hypothetical protein
MTTLIDTLSTVYSSRVNLPLVLLPETDVIIDDNEKSIDQLSDQSEQSHVIYGNGRRQFQFRRIYLMLL